MVTKSGRSVYQLAVSTPHTNGNEFGLLLPTPDASMSTGGRTFAPGTVSRTGKDLRTGRKRSVSLSAAIRQMCKWGGSGSREKLKTMVSLQELNGSLNPAWVSVMMGYPQDWLDIGTETGNEELPASAEKSLTDPIS
jgi:hypothetical protein